MVTRKKRQPIRLFVVEYRTRFMADWSPVGLASFPKKRDALSAVHLMRAGGSPLPNASLRVREYRRHG